MDKVTNQAELVRAPAPAFFTCENEVFKLWRGCKVGVIRYAFVVGEAPDRTPIYIACTGMRRAIGVKGTSHAHVAYYRETSAQRETPEVNVGLAIVVWIRVEEKLPNERLLGGSDGRFEPNGTIDLLKSGPAALESAGSGASR